MGLVKNLNYRQDRGPVQGDKIAEFLEDAYLKRYKAEFKKKRSFAPSKLAWNEGECPRYWYIAFNGAEFVEEGDALGQFNMESGIISHERIGNLFKESELKVLYIEKKIENEDPPIFGYIDIGLDRAGEEVVGEIKTTRTESFIHKQSKMKPPAYHLLQILIYMKLREVENGFILYENRNTGEILVLPVSIEGYEEYLDYLWDWMCEVRAAWENKTLPERPYRTNSKVCKRCPVRKTCWEDLDKGVVKIEKMRLPQV